MTTKDFNNLNIKKKTLTQKYRQIISKIFDKILVKIPEDPNSAKP